MILIVLASGKGSRLKGLTKNTPKCLVKINGKEIISYIEKIYYLFNKVYIVTGYKHFKIKQRYNTQNITTIYNSKYRSTNMVESLFVPKRYIDDDVLVTYSDIIYDQKIVQMIMKLKGSVMPIKKNWLKLWKSRMSLDQIKKDAENLEVKRKYVIQIGQKIKAKIPQFQFMGIIKLLKKDYFRMSKLYKKNKNKKIDMTNFINEYLKIGKIKAYATDKFWFEIDNQRDLRIVSKINVKCLNF
jgi:choline kinase